MSTHKKIPFTKMTGAGNDFVVVDNRAGELALSKEQIVHLCNRRFGIGADGVLVVEQPDIPLSDYNMRYYNADGGEAEMCGNGARCFAKFVETFPRDKEDEVSFFTPAGLVNARYRHAGEVEIDLTTPKDWKINEKADFGWGEIEYSYVNTGVPHVVLFSEHVETEKVVEKGHTIRHNALFEKGTNVNFVEVVNGKSLRVRTYERGVEDETLACGTGVVASALIANRVKHLKWPISCRVQSGQSLVISSDAEFYHVTMAGPALAVFHGEIEI